MRHFLEQSQIYVTAWFFPVEIDLSKSWIISEKRSVERPFPNIIVLRLKKK